MSTLDRSWEAIQQRVFTRWVNAQLVKKGTKIEDVTKDFADGLQLINLYEIISGKTFDKYNKKPVMKIHKINNLSIVINEVNKFVKQVGIHVEFSAEQVESGDKRTILGMIWCLIHKFSIQEISEEELSARDALLLWCQKQTAGYKGVHVQNFNTSWQDGLAFCALIHKYHPNLIDFDSLNKDDKAKNLQLAFDVAEKHLDIPALLDANDIVNTPKPDDKSIMAYVAYYWKKFASSKKGERSGRILSKLADKQEENNKLIIDYEDRARKLLAWMNDKNTQYSDNNIENFGNSLVKVQNTANSFKGFKNDEKPKQNAERADLELMLKNLHSKQKNEGLSLYQPPADIAPAALNTNWDGLEKTCTAYEKLLREAIQRMKNLELLLERFRKRAKQLLDWKANKSPYLKEDVKKLYETINAIQARIRGQEAFDEELKGMGSSCTETKKTGQEVIDGKHEAAPEVAETSSNLTTAIDATADESKQVMEALNEWLKFKQEVEANCLEFGNLVQQVNLALDDIGLSLIEPINVNSVEEADEKIDANNKLLERHASKQPTLATVSELHDKISAAGADSGIYSPLSHSAIHEKSSSVAEQLKARAVDLDKEKQVQIERASLLASWSAQCKEFIAWADENKATLSRDEEGSVWEQLAALDNKSASIVPESQSRVAKLTEFHQQLVANDIVSKVDVTLQEVNVLSSQLENISKKKNQDLTLKCKSFEKLFDRFKSRSAKISSWQQDKLAYLTSVAAKVTSIAQTQAEIKTAQAVEGEIKSVSQTWNETKQMGEQLIAAKHAESASISQTLSETDQKNADLTAKQTETVDELNKILAAKQEVENNCVELAKIVQAVNLFIEDASVQLAEAVKSRSVQEVEEKIAAANTLTSSHTEKQGLLDQAKALDDKITSAGANPSVYSGIALDTVAANFGALKEQVAARLAELDAEKTVQERNAQMLKEYTDSSAEYQKWVADTNQELSKEREGTLEEQLEAVKQLAPKAAEESEEKYKALAALYEQLEAADISELASITITELAALNEQVKSTGSKRIQTLQEQIVAAKLSDVTEDQLKEWSSTFRHFDAQKSGFLTKLQFKSACAAIGEDIPDNQLDSRFAQYDTDGDGKIEFNEFIDFMKTVSREGSGYNDILAAFAELANNGEFITEQQMRSVMPGSQVDYLIKVMPKKDSGYDYKAFCSDSFAKKD